MFWKLLNRLKNNVGRKDIKQKDLCTMYLKVPHIEGKNTVLINNIFVKEGQYIEAKTPVFEIKYRFLFVFPLKKEIKIRHPCQIEKIFIQTNYFYPTRVKAFKIKIENQYLSEEQQKQTKKQNNDGGDGDVSGEVSNIEEDLLNDLDDINWNWAYSGDGGDGGDDGGDD